MIDQRLRKMTGFEVCPYSRMLTVWHFHVYIFWKKKWFDLPYYVIKQPISKNVDVNADSIPENKEISVACCWIIEERANIVVQNYHSHNFS